jgi:hypothetical protein
VVFATGAILLGRRPVHGYTTAFAWSAGIFLFGAGVTALLFPRGVAKGAAAEEALVHPVAVHGEPLRRDAA